MQTLVPGKSSCQTESVWKVDTSCCPPGQDNDPLQLSRSVLSLELIHVKHFNPVKLGDAYFVLSYFQHSLKKFSKRPPHENSKAICFLASLVVSFSLGFVSAVFEIKVFEGK